MRFDDSERTAGFVVGAWQRKLHTLAHGASELVYRREPLLVAG
jgi:hypothetical protein